MSRNKIKHRKGYLEILRSVHIPLQLRYGDLMQCSNFRLSIATGLPYYNEVKLMVI